MTVKIAFSRRSIMRSMDWSSRFVLGGSQSWAGQRGSARRSPRCYGGWIVSRRHGVWCSSRRWRPAPRVLARRARVLESLAVVVDEGRANAKAPASLPALTAEGVVGATFGVIHARLLELRPEPLIELTGSLMATIVLPYRGSTAAAKELARPVLRGTPRARRRDGDGLSQRPLGLVSPVDYRLTVRTQMALAAVAGRPGLCNREVSEIIGLADQGQISRMMRRLQAQGLIENSQGHAKRQARAWRLTADGEAVIDAHKPLKRAQRKTSRGGKLAAKSTRRARHTPGSRVEAGAVKTGFRMTALTLQALSAVGDFDEAGSNPNNREIARATGVRDEGQISKLLARLQEHGLLENSAAHAAGGNAWRLTQHGEQLLAASSPGERTSKPGAGQPAAVKPANVKAREAR